MRSIRSPHARDHQPESADSILLRDLEGQKTVTGLTGQ